MQRRNYDSGTTQERKVFRALCPPELMTILEDPNIKPLAYEAICRMLQTLGFEHLAHEHDCAKTLRFSAEELTFDEKDLQLLPLYVHPLVNLFLDNIHSPGLRQLFEEKANSPL